jgi:hypothetical protein
MSNSKQETAVKLYTEEQVKEMFEQFQTHLPFHYEILLQQHLNQLKTIELPSDDEIDYAETQMPMNTFELGAKWMRNKIQGGKQ